MAEIVRYAAPRSLAEAVEILRGGNATILAGGTDLMPQSQAGRVKFQPVLMNIRRVAELAGVSLADGEARIGALTTISALMGDELVRRHFPILAEAGDHFASDQLRNSGTIGGNICNASPAGDTLVPLLVLDAKVELASKPGGSVRTRVVPISEFFAGPGRTRREPNELLVAVRLPLPQGERLQRFFKFGTRPALDISAISIGLHARREGKVLREVRVAFGAVAPTPLRAPATEAALEGKALSPSTIEAAACAARDEVHPISDVRASAWYRKEMIHNMMKRILTDAA